MMDGRHAVFCLKDHGLIGHEIPRGHTTPAAQGSQGLTTEGKSY